MSHRAVGFTLVMLQQGVAATTVALDGHTDTHAPRSRRWLVYENATGGIELPIHLFLVHRGPVVLEPP